MTRTILKFHRSQINEAPYGQIWDNLKVTYKVMGWIVIHKHEVRVCEYIIIYISNRINRGGKGLPYSTTPTNKHRRNKENRKSPHGQYHSNDYFRPGSSMNVNN